jgi:hypothetical protein
MFDAMKVMRSRMPPNTRCLPDVVTFSGAKDPAAIMKHWYEKYKITSHNQIPSENASVSNLFVILNCPGERFGYPLSHECMTSINNKVNVYNKIVITEMLESGPDEKERLT